MKHLAVHLFIGVALGSAAPALAQLDCAGWTTPGFFVIADVQDVRRCLSAGFDPEAREDDGWTRLHAAVATNRPAMVTALLEAGAGPGAKSKTGWTPLHVAAFNGQTEIMTALIDAGADPKARTALGFTAFDLAPDILRGTKAWGRLNDE